MRRVMQEQQEMVRIQQEQQMKALQEASQMRMAQFASPVSLSQVRVQTPSVQRPSDPVFLITG